MTSGGFVAGLKAGLAYNTFPLMAGHWIPPDLWDMQPWYRNLFENLTTVQFDHRILAVLTLLTVMLFWLIGRRHSLSEPARYGLHALLIVGVLQFSLGILTLVLRVPTSLASAHQAGALVLLTIALFLSHRLRH